MKKDKVYELRIEEDDEISGIDSISLVSEPAIEINWVAFNKVKPQEFHIPDGEDKKYLEFFNEKGQPEEELLKEGWVRVKEEFVSSTPNQPSFEDTNEYLVRYKYVKNPEAPGASVKETTREFCSDLISKNYVYRVEDLDTITNDEGDSALVWRGGYNCRHKWMQIKYHRDAKIVNKGSVTKGRIDDAESYDVLGYPQPDTRVPEWPSFSKQGFNSMDIYGFKPRYFHICPGAQATFEHLMSMNNDDDTIGMIRSAAQVADNVFRIEDEVIKAGKATELQLDEASVLVSDFKDIIGEIDTISGMKHDVSYMDGHLEKIKELIKEDMGYDVSTITGYVDEDIRKKRKKKEQLESYSDYPDSVKNNAKAVLKYVEENGWGSCGTDVGKQRANQLANGEPISEDTIRRMYSYLSRHEVDLESSKGYGDGCGKLMYDSWGGKSALSWAESKINAIDREKMSKQKFQTDDEKRIVVGPAMVPDLKIFRKDKKGNPYYVTFKEDTIKMIADKYMRNKYIDNNDTEHNGRAAEDVYVYESWIKESQEDKSTKYGFGDLPIGTWFVSMKVRNPIVWERIKKKELNGFSVSGFFEEIEQFKMEQQFLKELAEILKDL